MSIGTGTSDSILDELFSSLPHDFSSKPAPPQDLKEEETSIRKKKRNLSDGHGSSRSTSPEKVRKSAKKSKKKKRKDSCDSELSDSSKESSKTKKKKKKSKKSKKNYSDDDYEFKKLSKDKSASKHSLSELNPPSKRDEEIVKPQSQSRPTTAYVRQVECIGPSLINKKYVSPTKQADADSSKIPALTVTVSATKNESRLVGYGTTGPALDIPLPSSGITLDVIPLPRDKRDKEDVNPLLGFKKHTKINVLTGKEDLVQKPTQKIASANKLILPQTDVQKATVSQDSCEKDKVDDILKPASVEEENVMVKLISQVIEEVDAKEKLRAKYEDGELSSESGVEEAGEATKKKKKKKKEKPEKDSKKSKEIRSPSPKKRESRSRSPIHRRAKTSERRDHPRRSPVPSTRKRDRSFTPESVRRKSRSPRSSLHGGGRFRYSQHDHRRSPVRRSPQRQKSFYEDRKRRSLERNRRGNRSPVRPFRVGEPKKHRKTRSRSPSRRSRSKSPRFDKAKLLKIARQNLEKMKFAGILPEEITQGDVWKTIQAGGKTVKDLTDFCKRLAERGECGTESEESDKDEFRHPFQLKPAAQEKSAGFLQFNIKNAITLPIRSSGEIIQQSSKLKDQFPVSSGTTHRKTDNEWVPVVKSDEAKEVFKPVVTVSDAGHRMVKNQLGQKHESKERETNVVAPMPRDKASEKKQVVSISELVAKRITAMKRFQDNPKDAEAKRELEEIEEKTREWVSRKEREYEDNRPPNFIDFSMAPQSWASTAQFANAAPIASGPGLRLLQKMGWQHGEGLGRNKDGALEPLTLDIKMDKKGLVSREEEKPARLPITKAAKTAAGKHPISYLMEACGRRRWPPPHFEQALEAGPDHMKQFLFKVTVNNTDYRPVMASSTKKEAKAQCAAVCLQALGLLPKELS